jgi:hypothetical protein
MKYRFLGYDDKIGAFQIDIQTDNLKVISMEIHRNTKPEKKYFADVTDIINASMDVL